MPELQQLIQDALALTLGQEKRYYIGQSLLLVEFDQLARSNATNLYVQAYRIRPEWTQLFCEKFRPGRWSPEVDEVLLTGLLQAGLAAVQAESEVR
jgi:hypothetical protein